MVDWRIARRVAAGIAGDGGMPLLPGDLIALCDDAERRVSAYAQLTPLTPLPPPEAVSRGGWADANIGGMQGVLDPIAGRLGAGTGPFAGAVRSAAGAVLGLEVGALLGFLGQRVLGQYEVPPTDPERPARLLFVSPNLEAATERLEVDGAQMLRWVVLHEVTHAVQFSSVAWLRPHVASMVEELAGALEVKLDPGKLLSFGGFDDLRAAVDRVREDGLIGAALGPERRGLMDQIQATMALIEGHAEHVMDAAGVDVIEDLEKLRSAMEERRHNRPPVMRFIERMLGLEMKMRQYETGKRFCDAVVEREGVAGLNRAWASPETLPTWEEMQAPDAWIARVSGV